MTTATASAFFYTDPQGLTGLRRQARQNSPEGSREAAKQFEAVFIQMMLKSMRAASSGEGGLMENDQSRLYRDLFDQQIALNMAQQGQLGLAEQLTRQWTGNGTSAPPRPAGPAASSDTLATLRQVERIRSSVAMPASAPTAGPRGVDDDAQAYPAGDAPFEPTSPAAFVRRMWPHARVAAQRLGVAPEVLIAQAAHETGWGKSVPRFADGRSTHNLFGIKADRSWRGERANNSTLEYVGGAPVRQRDDFRAYRSYADSFNDYAEFLRANPRYSEALGLAGDGPAYLRALQRAGYATDPQYASKIQALMGGPAFDQALGTLKSALAWPISSSRG